MKRYKVLACKTVTYIYERTLEAGDMKKAKEMAYKEMEDKDYWNLIEEELDDFHVEKEEGAD